MVIYKIVSILNMYTKMVDIDNIFSLFSSHEDLDGNNTAVHIDFNRAWNYIKKIDTNNIEHCDAIEKLSDEYLDTALELGIHYYEPVEDYEKCAHLKKILDKSKEFQT